MLRFGVIREVYPSISPPASCTGTLCAIPMRKVLLTSIGILIWTIGLTCSCDYAGNFIKATSSVDLIAIIKIKDYGDFLNLREPHLIRLNNLCQLQL